MPPGPAADRPSSHLTSHSAIPCRSALSNVAADRHLSFLIHQCAASPPFLSLSSLFRGICYTYTSLLAIIACAIYPSCFLLSFLLLVGFIMDQTYFKFNKLIKLYGV
jgi:hypothetical protein